jgi:GTP pyrophosphokinase/guanosine-3',5'-bis(diphosphate) 3'-pyrophosphohydrolase
MEIYAPLAGRMGMQSIRQDLEDLAFRVLNFEARASIIKRFVVLQKENGDVVQRITDDMHSELEASGIRATIEGRAKKPYSIWRKMQEKALSFSRLSDIYGFRIICSSDEECYRVLGVIHKRWRAVPGRFKDYISQPKSNGYRSIHTTVSGRNARRVEVQIRTQQMHDVAESGIAAHWAYRDGVRSENPFTVDPVKWITTLIEEFNAEEDHEAFLEAVKLEMYSDKVFCFSPKGEVIKLPKGATPIDFAYAIHTRIGNSCVGAKIDGLRAPLWTRLRNGQSIEILTAIRQEPQATWLEMTETGKAKTAIRRALREADRDKYIIMGQQLLRAAFEHFGKKASDKALENVAKKLRVNDVQELYARLGSAELQPRDIINVIFPDFSTTKGPEIDQKLAVIGLAEGQSFNRRPCCQPLPGERIVGIATTGKGVSVHSIDCPTLVSFEDNMDLWLDLHWHAGKHPSIYPITLELTISNDAGVLGRVCTIVGDLGANISDMEFLDRKLDFFKLILTIDLRDVEHLHAILSRLDGEHAVATVSRTRRIGNQSD